MFTRWNGSQRLSTRSSLIWSFSRVTSEHKRFFGASLLCSPLFTFRLNGQGTSWSSQSTIMKWAPVLYSRGITWTTIFGNHDEEETDLTREAQVNLMKTLPYYVGEIGPNGVDGVGNYVRSIRANDTDTVLATLYFLDSHVRALSRRSLLTPRLELTLSHFAQAYAKSLKPWGDKTYDSLKANQCVSVPLLPTPPLVFSRPC